MNRKQFSYLLFAAVAIGVYLFLVPQPVSTTFTFQTSTGSNGTMLLSNNTKFTNSFVTGGDNKTALGFVYMPSNEVYIATNRAPIDVWGTCNHEMVHLAEDKKEEQLTWIESQGLEYRPPCNKMLWTLWTDG